MTPKRAIELVEDTALWLDAREYLEACLYVSTHPYMREEIGPGFYITACHLADYAVDHGEAAAVKLVQEVRYGKLPQ